MTDLSLNILDIANNSTRAKATLIVIFVEADTALDTLSFSITDNGCGMTREFVEKVTDPFTTTRTTRKVGMGLPLLKMEAEMAGGALVIESEVGKGTTITASFGLTHVDRPPLGDLAETFVTLIGGAPNCDFEFNYSLNEKKYYFSTKEVKQALDVAELTEVFVLNYIKEMLFENIQSINGGVCL